MASTIQIFTEFSRALRSTVTRQANWGILLAILAVIASTLFVAYMSAGELSIGAIGEAQRKNYALWVLDTMPVIFGLWGQYIGSLLAFEAGALVVDQTSKLRTQTEALEVQVLHGSTYDRLTDLPNRMLFHDRVEQAINNAKRNQEIMALLVLDMDEFKEVNNTLGHFSGDMLLKQLASRLRASVREIDTVARLGADEFAVLLPEIRQKDDAIHVARKLCQAMEREFILGGINLNMLMSIGVIFFPEHGGDVDTLLQKAEVALYLAKQTKGFSIEVYSPENDQHSTRRLTLLGELRQAIDHGGLLLHYQPKVDISSHRIVAVESLVRWQHPQYGMLPPDEFISLAERTGLIRPLTYWVIGEALKQCAAWQTHGFTIDVAVNVPVSVLLDSTFPERLEALLRQHRLAAGRLVVEITESSLMEDQEYALQLLSHLSSIGVRISIDDFGTGYSSLAYLRRLPVSEIKIDQSFVMGMLENENDAVIVHATIGLAHNLGMTAIAEGVAEAAILKKLTVWGCNLAQGHHISPPVDGKAITQLLGNSEWRMH
ncbi:MAG: bifunctional diguanylate cyclase/phosphodiesterase [Gammaproteobacteria bacterium]|nr:bifunctional diguanylate cyclase/phosphodiesterase [Gammaproteobacteria bacterium]